MADTSKKAQLYFQELAAKSGYCPAPVNEVLYDVYDVHSATLTGNKPLSRALAQHLGHVFVTTDPDPEAWCVWCDHRAQIWPGRRVFIDPSVTCARGVE